MSDSTPSYMESYTDEEHEAAWGDDCCEDDDDFDEDYEDEE